MLSIPIIAEPPLEGVPKRRFLRQRIETLVYADLGPGNGGFPINVSEEGMAFQGIQPLEKGHVICVRFKLPGTNDKVEVTGQIVWLNHLGKGGGLHFIELSQETRHLIHQWLDLQAQPGKHTDDEPVGAQQVEKRRIHISPPQPQAGRRTHADSEAEEHSIVPLPPSAIPSGTVTQAIGRSKSSAELLSTEDPSQTIVRGTGGKRTWIMPFTIGLMIFPAIMIAIMVIFGVISVQLRWPHLIAGENPAGPVAQSGTANAPGAASEKTSMNESAPKESVPNPAALTVSSTSRTQVPKVRADVSGLPAIESSPAKAATPAKINSPKAPLEEIEATAKPRVPRPMTPAKPADFTPPSFALPTKSELAPQLPMISGGSPALAPPARQGGKFEAPQLISRKDPVYPVVAKTAGISGSVELKFTITAEGNVHDVTVIKGNHVLAGAAVQAAQAWHYQPARLDGIPVETQSTAIINFKAN